MLIYNDLDFYKDILNTLQKNQHKIHLLNHGYALDQQEKQALNYGFQHNQTVRYNYKYHLLRL
jgi:hypothetical protein